MHQSFKWHSGYRWLEAFQINLPDAHQDNTDEHGYHWLNHLKRSYDLAQATFIEYVSQNEALKPYFDAQFAHYFKEQTYRPLSEHNAMR